MGNPDADLKAHLDRIDANEEREAEIEYKTVEIKDKLLSVSHKYEEAFVIDAQGNKIELLDFICNMDINEGLFAEYLMYGGGLLKDKLNEQLNELCEDVATGLIDKRG